MSTGIQIDYVFVLAGLLFSTGLAGLLVRRDLIFILLSLEIMLNAGGLAFVAAGAKWGEADGQVMFLFVLAVAAAEVAVALALILRFHRLHRTLRTEAARQMRG